MRTPRAKSRRRIIIIIRRDNDDDSDSNLQMCLNFANDHFGASSFPLVSVKPVSVQAAN
jgi:hypothetical protein